MITYSIIKKSQLEGAKRLDAEFFHPEKLQAKLALEKLKGRNISDYFTNSKKLFNPLNKKLEGETIVYDLTDALGLFLGDGEIVNSEKEIGSTKKIIQQNDVIISRLRSYLKEISFIYDNNKLKLASTEFVVLRQKEKMIYPEVLFSFLQTDIVQKILEWSQEGVNHPRFSENELMSLKFPDVLIKNKDYLKELVVKSNDLFINSKSLYSQAEKLLLEELGLENFEEETERELWSVVNLSEVKKSNRIDSEYFQPKYQKLFSAIKKYQVKTLGELATIKKGFEPGSEAYQDEGKLFIRVSSISKDGITDKDQKYLKDDLYQKLKKDFEPKVGEILLTKDASPGVAFVVKEQIEGLISGGVLRLKLKKDVEPEYIALVINSFVGQMQVERDAGGSIIAHWKSEQVKELQIPVLPKETQQKIAELVQKSHEARKKAKELLEEAKRKVENLIEDKSVKDNPLGQEQFKDHL